MTTSTTQEKTGLGNYFVANYPPFSFWKPEHLPAAQAALDADPEPGAPLGLYLHVPFCRKRCKFCYFRVYTDKNAREIETYVEALATEVALCAKARLIGGRPFNYVYFGGGTPSYLSANQLRDLFTRVRQHLSFDGAEEVTFECEPGTLQRHKLETLRELGVTRLSLGIENFDPKILEFNGRAHLEEEVYRAFGWAREIGFPQVNIDLIAGMVGETWPNWERCVAKTLELAPESVTIYQMELPYNTTFSKQLTVLGQDEPAALEVADWPTKRAWVDYAFNTMQAAGYKVSSAYTLKKSDDVKFVYRDSLWRGADMFGTGVASFGHLHGVHVQNVDTWEKYVGLLQEGKLPLGRALPIGPRERLVREMILQLKTTRLDPAYFAKKFGVDIVTEFADGWRELTDAGHATVTPTEVALTRQGMLVVDRLLPTFFDPKYRTDRYT